MKKVIFKNKSLSYLLVSALGVVAGLAVAFFSIFPHDDLWAFALFSSTTLGFWIFTCSLIALFSEKSYVAGINIALYVYFMFYITGIFKRLAVVIRGINTMSYFRNGLWEELAYGAPYAAVCFVLAFLLWYGRKNGLAFTVLRFLPSLCISAEAISLGAKLAADGQGLFMLIIDILCAAAYTLIMIRASDFGPSCRRAADGGNKNV